MTTEIKIALEHALAALRELDEAWPLPVGRRAKDAIAMAKAALSHNEQKTVPLVVELNEPETDKVPSPGCSTLGDTPEPSWSLELAPLDERTEALVQRQANEILTIEGLRKFAAAAQDLVPARKPIHFTVLIDWLSARYRAAGGRDQITDVSAWAEEVMRWTEEQHSIGGSKSD